MAIIQTVIAGGGTTPTGTKNITTNGTHNVAAYEYADVQVPTTAPTYYKEFVVNANGFATGSTNVMNFNGIKDCSECCFYGLYYRNTALSGTVDMSSIQSLRAYSGYQMFCGCTGLTSIDLSSLTTLSANEPCAQMFDSCTGLTSADLSSLTTASGYNSCSMMFNSCSNLTSADLSSLTTASGNYACQQMFKNCSRLTSINLSSLTTIGSYSCYQMFYNCTRLTSIDLSSLTTASNNYSCSQMFDGCKGLTSADLSSLTTLGGNSCYQMFQSCTQLTSVDLSSLTTFSGANSCLRMFNGCSNLTSLSFPSITPNSFGAYTNQFTYLCLNIPAITLHFPSNTQAKIETLFGYPGFGCTSASVLFDLPATNTLTGADTVTYTRNPKYDTATALAWKVGAYGTTNFTPAYYTSGTTDPAVSDTIYSDAACTTAVTTVSAIA